MNIISYESSEDLLNGIYDIGKEKQFLKFCEKQLKVKIRWIDGRGQYEVIEKR